MPLTAIDPHTALIVIDLQKGIVNGDFVHPIGDVINRTRTLIDAFRAKNLPVVLVNVAGRAPGRTEQGSRSNVSFSKDGATLYQSWIDSRTILPSPSEAGERSRQRISNSNLRREA